MTVWTDAFILGAAIISKVPGLRQPEAVLFWLIRVDGSCGGLFWVKSRGIYDLQKEAAEEKYVDIG